MWLAVLGLLFGLVLGFITNITIPANYADYLSIAVLAAFDTLLGGIRAQLQKSYDNFVFVTGFFFNIFLK